MYLYRLLYRFFRFLSYSLDSLLLRVYLVVWGGNHDRRRTGMLRDCTRMRREDREIIEIIVRYN